MNKEELEALVTRETAPLLYRLAVTIAAHPLRWTGSALILGLAIGLFL